MYFLLLLAGAFRGGFKDYSLVRGFFFLGLVVFLGNWFFDNTEGMYF